jgi:nucleotide-binding universal stress UspA family protein
MFRNILVGYDGSPHAERALDEAIDLAVASRARLTILTSVPRPQPWVFTGLTAGPAMALTAELSNESEQILRRGSDRVPGDVPLTTVLERCPPVAALRKRMGEGGHDLVVVGSRGRGALRSALLGSVSRALQRGATVPVLVVHGEPAKAGRTAPAPASVPRVSSPALKTFAGPR